MWIWISQKRIQEMEKRIAVLEEKQLSVEKEGSNLDELQRQPNED